jgi:alkylhydroperoxidase/carboxymuconolactone decarboxylase family protein YurZ
MSKIRIYLNASVRKKKFSHMALALLSSSAVLRKEKALREILSFLKEKQYSSRKIYEALLQTYLFAGYPSALISLSVYSEYFDKGTNEIENKGLKPLRKRVEENCRIIYGNKYEKLIRNINTYSPELADWLVTEGYGKVIGRSGLSLIEREVCSIAVLTALKFESQLYSHINGGHRLGLHWTEIQNIIESLRLLDNIDCVKFGNKVLKNFVERKNLHRDQGLSAPKKMTGRS